MADNVLGSAYVLIRAITKNLGRDIAKGVDKAAMDADSRIRDGAGQRIGQALGESISEKMSTVLRDEMIDSDLGVDIGQHLGDTVSDHMEDRMSGLGDRLADSVGDDIGQKLGERIGDQVGETAGEHFGESLIDRIDADAPHIGKDAGEHVGEELGDGIDRGSRGPISRMGSGFRQRLEKAFAPDKNGRGVGTRIGLAVGRGLTDTIGKIHIPALLWMSILAVPALGGAIKIIGAYLSSVVSLAAAMGPAFAGAGAVALGSMISLQAAMQSIKIALNTETELLETFQEQLQGTKDAWKDVARTIQRQVLPRLLDAARTIENLFPTLAEGLAKVGAATGDVAKGLALILTRSDNLVRIRDIFAGADPIVRSFGHALGNIVDILLIVARAALPITQRFAAWVATMTDGLLVATRAGEASGRLAAFLQRAGDVAAQLGRIFRGTFEGLIGLFHAAAPAGQTLLDRIEALTDRFAAFTQSADGQNRLKAFFDNMLPVIQAVNGLIGDLFRLIGKSLETDNSGLLQFIDILRTDVIPALATMGSTISKTVGPALLELVEGFANLITALSESGALGAFVDTLTIVFETISDLLDLPVVGKLIGWAVAFLGITKALDLVSFGLFSKLLGKLAEYVIPYLITGLRLLGTALLTTPIGWIILGITALVTAFILLWKNSEAFRDFWIGLWDTIKDMAASVVQWFTTSVVPFMQGVWDGLISGLQEVWDFFQTAWQGIQDAVSVVVDWFTTTVLPPLQTIWDALSDGAQRLWDKTVEAWDGIKAAADEVIAPLVDMFTTYSDVLTQDIIPAVETAAGAIADFAQGALAWLGDRVQDVIDGLIPLVRAFINLEKWIAGRIIDGVKFLGEMFASIAGVILDLLIPALKRFGGFVMQILRPVFELVVSLGEIFIETFGGVIVGVLNFLAGLFESVWSVIQGIFNVIIGLVTGDFSQAWEGLKQLIGGVWNFITSTIGAAFTIISSLITGGWKAVAAVFNAAWDIIFEIVRAGWSMFIAFWSTIGSTMVGIVQGAWNWVASAFVAGWNAVYAFVVGIPQMLYDGLVSMISFLTTLASSAWTAFWTTAQAVWATIWAWVITLPQAIWDGMIALVGFLGTLASNAWNSFWTAAQGVWDSIYAWVTGLPGQIIAGLASLAGLLLAAGRNALGRLWQGFREIFTNALDWIRGLPDQIIGGLGDLGGMLLDAGRAIIEGLAQGIRNGVGAVGDAIDWVLDKLPDWFPGSPVKRGPLRILNNGRAGKSIVKMIADGISSERGSVQKAVARVAEAAAINVGGINVGSSGGTVSRVGSSLAAAKSGASVVAASQSGSFDQAKLEKALERGLKKAAKIGPSLNIVQHYPQAEPASDTISRANDMWRALA